MTVRLATLCLFATLPLAAHPADRAPRPVPLFTLVNATFQSAVAVSVGDAGSGGWEAVPLGAPLPGGLAAATVRLPDGGCARDIRVTFRDGRSTVLRDIDVCRTHRVRLDARPGPVSR